MDALTNLITVIISQYIQISSRSLYTLYFHSVICQLYLNEALKKKEKKEKEIKTPQNRKAYIHLQPSTVFMTIAGYLSSSSLFPIL